ncbi:hypothetical protein NLG97_g6478 [Lecanicillium saksenae]|uniref:Uncharacterized protein n=1 Tax=Lecanicillium saksenae TaxID=468837 RepID=A0ACC1QPN1_9HYPO|nr:hypothetical protein NLG97_g6478 [Lecanicillium saksenae]
MMPSGRAGQTLAYGKSCLPGASLRALGGQKNNAISRIAQLEGKLDGLVSLLGTARVLDQASAATTSALPSPPHQPAPAISSQAPTSGSAPPPGPSTRVRSKSSGAPVSNEPSWEESEECVRRFRTEMLQYFPFLNLPSNTHQLSRERPFLFRCVVAAAAPSTRLKLALGRSIKQTLAQRMVVETGPDSITLDLLLGLLVFLAWGHDYILQSNPATLSRFTQFAIAIVFELRLNKMPPVESNMLPGGGQSQECSLGMMDSCQSLDEIRALFACFIMSSIDQVLSCQVRLQLVAADTETARNTTTAAAFYVKSLRSNVSRINASIPAALVNDRALNASLYYTELSILSLALSDRSHKPGQDLHRLEAQHECLNIIKVALDSFFSIPLAEYAGISFPFFTHLARYILVLYKLSTVEEPSLDGNLVRSSVDVLQVMDRLIGNIQQARSMDGERSAGGLLDKSLKIFASICEFELQSEALTMTPNVENYEIAPLTAEKGAAEVASEDSNGEETIEYVTGLRLISILVAGTLVQFVMMPDQSIIGTVGVSLLTLRR